MDHCELIKNTGFDIAAPLLSKYVKNFERKMKLLMSLKLKLGLIVIRPTDFSDKNIIYNRNFIIRNKN